MNALIHRSIITKMFSSRYVKSFIRNNSKIFRRCTRINRTVAGTSSFCRSSNNNNIKIMGIETSCDDTGCAIVDGDGSILGEAIHSQLLVHLKNGGVIPPLAQDLHREHMEPVVEETLLRANATLDDVDAIAVTMKPGLPLSLSIGFKYAKHLATRHSKPLIPVHHMRAHALTIRAVERVDLPYLCLLISGGHCLLTLVNDVDDFKVLGETVDDSPGELLDKAARRLKLNTIRELSTVCGGRAVEMAARHSTDVTAYEFPTVKFATRNCDFSLSGIKSAMYKRILEKEAELGLEGADVVPDAFDLCASLQLHIARHICHKVSRAMEYVRLKDLVPADRRTLVVSGGVACNDFVFKALEIAGGQADFAVKRPPPKLCTDNGVMIAWNGVELWRRNKDIFHRFDTFKVQPRCPIGESIREDVVREHIECRMLPLNTMYELQRDSRCR